MVLLIDANVLDSVVVMCELVFVVIVREDTTKKTLINIDLRRYYRSMLLDLLLVE